MERKTSLICRCRPFRGLALALFALFGGLATAAQAMLLTLDLRWTDTDLMGAVEDDAAYHLQEGSIIQVIGYNSKTVLPPPESIDLNPAVNIQFEQYGTASEQSSAEPYQSGHFPDTSAVYLADSTQNGHDILYTGAIEDKGSWYGLFTQITVDSYLYDTVYIRVFGATEFLQGEAIASYWGVSEAQPLHPSFYTDTFAKTNMVAGSLNYFEVIPEPATLGLLGMGTVALVAWRRRRFARKAGIALEREED